MGGIGTGRGNTGAVRDFANQELFRMSKEFENQRNLGQWDVSRSFDYKLERWFRRWEAELSLFVVGAAIGTWLHIAWFFLQG